MFSHLRTSVQSADETSLDEVHGSEVAERRSGPPDSLGRRIRSKGREGDKEDRWNSAGVRISPRSRDLDGL